MILTMSGSGRSIKSSRSSVEVDDDTNDTWMTDSVDLQVGGSSQVSATLGCWSERGDSDPLRVASLSYPLSSERHVKGPKAADWR